MEPTATAATPTPPASPKAVGSSKRQRRAALPLGDVTNLLPSTPAPSTRRPRPAPGASASASTSSSASASAPVTPASRTLPAAAAAEEHSLVKSPISTVYTRRKTNTRRDPASCPPLGKSARTSSHSTQKASTTLDGRPISSSIPCCEAKKKRCLGMKDLSLDQLKLPEDFVKKQRAYFQEVDAFELPEEVVSETEHE